MHDWKRHLIALVAAALFAPACATSNSTEREFERETETRTEIEGPDGLEYETETETEIEREDGEYEVRRTTETALDGEGTEFERKSLTVRKYDADGDEIESAARDESEFEYESGDTKVESESVAKASAEFDDDRLELNLERRTQYEAEWRAPQSSEAGLSAGDRAEQASKAGSQGVEFGPDGLIVIAGVEIDDEKAAARARQEMANAPMVHFSYDDESLDSRDKRILRERAEWIKNNPGATIVIEGHTDERGSDAYNLALGERRAKAVKDYLTSIGVDGSRLNIVSYGEEEPLVDRTAGWAHDLNRRAEIETATESASQ